MSTVLPDKLGRRRLKRLLHAHEEKAFEGTIPWDCAEAIAAHEQIDREYERAWQMMLAHLLMHSCYFPRRFTVAENSRPNGDIVVWSE